MNVGGDASDTKRWLVLLDYILKIVPLENVQSGTLCVHQAIFFGRVLFVWMSTYDRFVPNIKIYTRITEGNTTAAMSYISV